MRALLVLAFTALTAPAFAQSAAPEAPPSQLAVVVLTGEASGNTALSDVISELLLRQGVEPQVESQAQFSPDAFLDSNPRDARSYAFVSVRSRDRAKLYFRGPHGQRFLLRELSLRDGLDELGRELIARVVETSMVALLDSREGVSQAEARAELAKDPEPAPTESGSAPTPVASSAPEPGPEPAPVRASLSPLFALRAVGHYTGPDLGPRFALGLEAGVRYSAPRWPKLGARLSFEAALPQELDADEAEATLLTFPIRAGLELGTSFDLFFALSAGVDIVHLNPERASSSELTPNDASTELTPVGRTEIRYELALSSSLSLALVALADVPLTTTRYDVIQDGARNTLARPWAVQPGLAIGLGFSP
jgi:hypothetical protein